jgi:hypothetical protein
MPITEHSTWMLETDLAPEAVLRALTDFGPGRAATWPETSHPKVFKVHEVGDTWAEVTEGVPLSWSRERYDWSVPGRVTLRQLDSNVAVPGGRIDYTIEPIAGGTRITCDRRRTFRNAPDAIFVVSIMRAIGPWILRRQFAGTLRRIGARA